MPWIRLFSRAILILALVPASLCSAGELEEMRAALLSLQKQLQQQQARIEQLEKQVEGRTGQTLPASLPLMAESPTSPQPETQAVVPGINTEPALATVYGRVDLFGEANWGGSKGERLAMDSGGMNGTRFGVMGGKALTPELTAIYNFETGFYGNNGRLGQGDAGGSRIFGRQALIGLEGRLGRLTIGRQYSPFFLEMMVFDAFDNGYGSPTNDGNVKPGPTRYDNAFIYTTPRLKGLSVTGLIALGGQTGETERNTLGINLDYASGPLGIGVSYQYDNHNALFDRSSRHAFTGASYQLGRVKLMGGIAGVDVRPDSGLATDWRSWFVGSSIDVTASGQLRLNVGEGHTRQAVVSDRGRVFSVAWVESITRQFKAYLALAHHQNDPGAALVPSGSSAYSYYSVNPGDNNTGLAIGVQYSF